MDILERHSEKWIAEPNTGCYLWTGALSNGRPEISQKDKPKYVARLVCEETNGPSPSPKHDAAHNTPNGCVGALCVNGGHLRWATRSENLRDVSPEQRKKNNELGREISLFNRRMWSRRLKAKEAGNKTYVSDDPCPKCQTNVRYVSSCGCAKCLLIRTRERRSK